MEKLQGIKFCQEKCVYYGQCRVNFDYANCLCYQKACKTYDMIAEINDTANENAKEMASRPVFKVVVAGSRGFVEYELMVSILDKVLAKKFLSHNVKIVSGMAQGADTLAIQYAKKRNLEVIEMPADWNFFGKMAGYIRNEAMVKIADAVVCFWDGTSRGTEHTINLTKKYNKPLRVIKYEVKNV